MNRGNKYNARRVTIDGVTYDSQAESRRGVELAMMEKGGAISGLRVHPRYLIVDRFVHEGHVIRASYYEADFEYIENGRRIVEDVKGVVTEVFGLKKKLFLLRYGATHELRIIKAR